MLEPLACFDTERHTFILLFVHATRNAIILIVAVI